MVNSLTSQCSRLTEAKLAKVTFLTPHSAFLDLHSMPETVEISLTVGLATLSPLTLLRRDDGFHNARVLVPGMDQDTTFRGVHLNDFALFTGMSSHGVNVAVGLHRTWLTNNSIDLQLADDSLLVVNDSAFSLKPLPRSRQTRSADDALEKRYRLFPRFPEAGAHVTFNSGGDHQRSRRETRSERKDKTTLYLDICVVVDYHLFKKVKDKHGTWGGVQLDLKETRRYVAMVMNEASVVNLLYKIWSDNSPFNVNIGIASIAVEVNPDMDFFGLQARPEVRLKSDGLVLQDILATHDIVTAWFKTYHSYLSCDHLMLLSGTTAAETVADAYGDPILVLSDILGIAWNFAFCSVADGLSSSVVITDRVRTFILAAHELGHR
ncbi:hypothetical protein BaRGS_00040213 [Batillaria attramentaria]|uniref:Uncharacterized protein n=1 Tax=Batillaria attramentaria TaxID=370345 RepID=A0ABD0J190_9CAEN